LRARTPCGRSRRSCEVEAEQAVEKRTHGEDAEGNHPDSRREGRPDGLPEAECQREEEQPGQVGAKLVIEPGHVGRERTQIADVVVDDAVVVRLGQSAEEPASDERDRRE
jgi:hypothetical protein